MFDLLIAGQCECCGMNWRAPYCCERCAGGGRLVSLSSCTQLQLQPGGRAAAAQPSFRTFSHYVSARPGAAVF